VYGIRALLVILHGSDRWMFTKQKITRKKAAELSFLAAVAAEERMKDVRTLETN
jgi:hypothetical protein